MVTGAYISAQDAIKTLCLRMDDMTLSKGAKYASYLPTVYNELRIDVTHTSVIKKFQINKNTNSLAIPNDCMLLYGVGYVDECGAVQPLWYNTKIAQAILFDNGKPCDCDTCGGTHDDCGVIGSVDKQEIVVTLNDEELTKTITRIVLKDGTIVEKVREPIAVEDSYEWIESEKELCALDLAPCGCVMKTQHNTDALSKYDCGCWNFETNCGTYNKFMKKEFGYTMDITGTQIVLDPSFPYDYLVLKYAAHISSQKDYKIPIIALEALISGILYYEETDNVKSPGYVRGVGGMRYQKYYAEKKKLAKRLRPTSFQRALGAMGIVDMRDCKNKFEYYNRAWIGKRCCI